jgi:methylamine dehydrogenase accessory protein MauD
MNILLLVSSIALWLLVLLLGFLLLGAVRALGIVKWQLEQLQATTPSRLGRDGLRVGKKAPAFSLPCVPPFNHRLRFGKGGKGGDVSLADFAGRKVLLMFTQSGCSPCKAIVPELNWVEQRGTHQVLVVNNGDPEKTRLWAQEVDARFPVLAQENHALSKRFQVFATPFAFLIDEKGIIVSKGIAGSKQHLNFVLSGAGKAAEKHVSNSTGDLADEDPSEKSLPFSIPSKEVEHV